MGHRIRIGSKFPLHRLSDDRAGWLGSHASLPVPLELFAMPVHGGSDEGKRHILEPERFSDKCKEKKKKRNKHSKLENGD